MQVRLHKGLCPIVIIIAAEFLYRHDDTAWRTKKFWANQLVKFNYKRKRYCNFIFRFAWFLWWVKALHTVEFLWMSLRLIPYGHFFCLIRNKSLLKSCHIWQWQQKHIYITFLESHWYSNMTSNQILIDWFGFIYKKWSRQSPTSQMHILITFLRSKENISVWKNIVSLKYHERR